MIIKFFNKKFMLLNLLILISLFLVIVYFNYNNKIIEGNKCDDCNKLNDNQDDCLELCNEDDSESSAEEAYSNSSVGENNDESTFSQSLK